ncbi:MAG TPA: PAS domain-containing protein [Caulobacteraceae bacterium]|nr:PAS domain-containing protein [Caulobacteraceae bacterium]
MSILFQEPEAILRVAIDATAGAPENLKVVIESLAAPIYITDAEGVITCFNSACVRFAGRTPMAGKDRWCVSWKLYTDAGTFLPHDQCPMADAIRTRTPVRGVSAIAERPDGARVAFIPFPTPIFDEDGAFVGAVNMLIDVTDVRQIADLRAQAARCHRLADAMTDKTTVAALTRMAQEYESKAETLQAAPASTDT